MYFWADDGWIVFLQNITFLHSFQMQKIFYSISLIVAGQLRLLLCWISAQEFLIKYLWIELYNCFRMGTE